MLVQPLFDSTRPLPAGALRDDLLALARADGVPVRDVLVADASRRTTALNAYVPPPERRGLVLAQLMRLKQICNHPAQLLGHGDFDPKSSGKFQRLRELCEEHGTALLLVTPSEEAARICPRRLHLRDGALAAV